jgi:hypothetical protein
MGLNLQHHEWHDFKFTIISTGDEMDEGGFSPGGDNEDAYAQYREKHRGKKHALKKNRGQGEPVVKTRANSKEESGAG